MRVAVGGWLMVDVLGPLPAGLTLVAAGFVSTMVIDSRAVE